MKSRIEALVKVKRLKARSLDEEGLTLIEIMVSMMIFLVVSTGIAGTMIAGLRANVSARQATFGKETAQQRFEEMRARPFYVPYDSDVSVGTTADIDLLDRYYPNLATSQTTDDQGWTGSYYSGSDAHYTKISPPDTHGIVTTVETRFVDANRVVVVPPSSYDTNLTGSDTPPSELVDVIVTTSWTDRSDQDSYTLESLISSTGQTPPVSETGCENSSESRVDVKGSILTVSTGAADPYTVLVNGVLGEAHASAVYPCETAITASGIGGLMAIVGGSTYTGAEASVTGPPEAHQSVGPTSVGPPSTWPKPTISNSLAKGKIEAEGGLLEIEAEGEANVGTQSLQLSEVSGTPTGTLSGYRRWDFINPTITATGSGGGDDGEDIEAEIEQDNGRTVGKADVFYQQINMIPLEKWPTDTTTNPSAAQGIAFIRNFQATANARADGTTGGASATMTYSFTLGMFNPNKSGCSSSSMGDTCYDIYSGSEAITPSHPLQSVLLSNSNYGLQNALITDWYSSTTTDINNAMHVDPNGKTATISIESLVKISSMYGTEIRWENSNNQVTLMNPAGLQQLSVGVIDISVVQNG